MVNNWNILQILKRNESIPHEEIGVREEVGKHLKQRLPLEDERW